MTTRKIRYKVFNIENRLKKDGEETGSPNNFEG